MKKLRTYLRCKENSALGGKGVTMGKKEKKKKKEKERKEREKKKKRKEKEKENKNKNSQKIVMRSLCCSPIKE